MHCRLVSLQYRFTKLAFSREFPALLPPQAESLIDISYYKIPWELFADSHYKTNSSHQHHGKYIEKQCGEIKPASITDVI